MFNLKIIIMWHDRYQGSAKFDNKCSSFISPRSLVTRQSARALAARESVRNTQDREREVTSTIARICRDLRKINSSASMSFAAVTLGNRCSFRNSFIPDYFGMDPVQGLFRAQWTVNAALRPSSGFMDLTVNDVYEFHVWSAEYFRSFQISIFRVRPRTCKQPAAFIRIRTQHLPSTWIALRRTPPARCCVPLQPAAGIRLPRAGERSCCGCLHALPAKQPQQYSGAHEGWGDEWVSSWNLKVWGSVGVCFGICNQVC